LLFLRCPLPGGDFPFFVIVTVIVATGPRLPARSTAWARSWWLPRRSFFETRAGHE